MKNKYKAGLAIASGTSLAAIVLMVGVGSAQQASPPPTLLYSGYLEEAGEPAEGTKQIGLSLWNADTTQDPQARVCQQAPAATAVAGGWFSLGLADACLAALRAHPALHLEFNVEGVAFPLQPIAPVPYALRTVDSGGGSRLRRIVIQGDDGSSHAHATRFWDSQREEECSFRKQGALLICAPSLLPNVGGSSCTPGVIAAGWYTDATCQTLAGVPAGSVASSTPLTYLASASATSGLAAVSGSVAAYWGCGSCSASSSTVYLKGADIDANAFVAGTESHD